MAECLKIGDEVIIAEKDFIENKNISYFQRLKVTRITDKYIIIDKELMFKKESGLSKKEKGLYCPLKKLFLIDEIGTEILKIREKVAFIKCFRRINRDLNFNVLLDSEIEDLYNLLVKLEKIR